MSDKPSRKPQSSESGKEKFKALRQSLAGFLGAAGANRVLADSKHIDLPDPDTSADNIDNSTYDSESSTPNEAHSPAQAGPVGQHSDASKQYGIDYKPSYVPSSGANKRILADLCQEYGVPFECAKRLIQHESEWKPDAKYVNPKTRKENKAYGLAQIKPIYLKDYNKFAETREHWKAVTKHSDLFDPRTNLTVFIRVTAHYMKTLQGIKDYLTKYPDRYGFAMYILHHDGAGKEGGRKTLKYLEQAKPPTDYDQYKKFYGSSATPKKFQTFLAVVKIALKVQGQPEPELKQTPWQASDWTQHVIFIGDSVPSGMAIQAGQNSVLDYHSKYAFSGESSNNVLSKVTVDKLNQSSTAKYGVVLFGYNDIGGSKKANPEQVAAAVKKVGKNYQTMIQRLKDAGKIPIALIPHSATYSTLDPQDVQALIAAVKESIPAGTKTLDLSGYNIDLHPTNYYNEWLVKIQALINQDQKTG